jgi:hypothetical protein
LARGGFALPLVMTTTESTTMTPREIVIIAGKDGTSASSDGSGGT